MTELQGIEKVIRETLERGGEKVFSLQFIQKEIPGVLEFMVAFQDGSMLLAKVDMSYQVLGALPPVVIHGKLYRTEPEGV